MIHLCNTGTNKGTCGRTAKDLVARHTMVDHQRVVRWEPVCGIHGNQERREGRKVVALADRTEDMALYEREVITWIL